MMAGTLTVGGPCSRTERYASLVSHFFMGRLEHYILAHNNNYKALLGSPGRRLNNTLSYICETPFPPIYPVQALSCYEPECQASPFRSLGSIFHCPLFTSSLDKMMLQMRHNLDRQSSPRIFRIPV